MHDRQQHVRIASKISVMRKLHKFQKDSFLGRPYLMFIFSVGHASRDRNTSKQHFTLRIVNMVVITHYLCLSPNLFFDTP